MIRSKNKNSWRFKDEKGKTKGRKMRYKIEMRGVSKMIKSNN